MRRSRVRPGVYRGVLWTRKKPTPRQQPSTTGTPARIVRPRAAPRYGAVAVPGCRSRPRTVSWRNTRSEIPPSDLCRLRTGAPLV